MNSTAICLSCTLPECDEYDPKCKLIENNDIKKTLTLSEKERRKKEYVKAYNKKYYQKNRDKIIERSKKWSKEHYRKTKDRAHVYDAYQKKYKEKNKLKT